MSERLTWATCPKCQRLATFRWSGGNPVQLDCPTGCRLTLSPTAPPSAWSSAVTPDHPAPLLDAVRDGGSEALVLKAEELAHRLIGGLGGRWSHTEGVARGAASVAAAVPDADRPALVAAAWLHDIGYAEPLARCGFHPLDGAFHLQDAHWGSPVAGLVAHHSGARFVAAVRGLSALMEQFDADKYAIGPMADALTYADQTTGPDGRPMAVEDRFTDMLNRHGPHSPQAQVHPARAPAIRAAVRRTEERLHDARTGVRGGDRTRSNVSN